MHVPGAERGERGSPFHDGDGVTPLLHVAGVSDRVPATLQLHLGVMFGCRTHGQAARTPLASCRPGQTRGPPLRQWSFAFPDGLRELLELL